MEKPTTAGRPIHLWDVPDNGKDRERATLKDHSDAVYGLSAIPTKPPRVCRCGSRLRLGCRPAIVSTRSVTQRIGSIACRGARWEVPAAGGVDKSVRVWAADKDGGKLVHSVFARRSQSGGSRSRSGSTLYSVGEDKHQSLGRDEDDRRESSTLSRMRYLTRCTSESNSRSPASMARVSSRCHHGKDDRSEPDQLVPPRRGYHRAAFRSAAFDDHRRFEPRFHNECRNHGRTVTSGAPRTASRSASTPSGGNTGFAG